MPARQTAKSIQRSISNRSVDGVRTPTSKSNDAITPTEQCASVRPLKHTGGQKDEISATTTSKPSDRKRKAQTSDTEAILTDEKPNSVKPQKIKQRQQSRTETAQITKRDAMIASKRTSKKTAFKEDEEAGTERATSVPKRRKTKVQQEKKVELCKDGERKVKRKRKTQEEKEADTMPLAARSTCLRMFIGAHVSCAKGVHNSVTNAVHIGSNAFAMFLKSQRKWENPPLQDGHCHQFKGLCSEHGYDATQHILPHGSYLVNLAQEDPEKASQAYNAFLDDLKRCDVLGIQLYNFHPGWTGSASRPSAIGRIASALNRAHLDTATVIPVLEAMAGAGNVIGSTFEDLRDIIALIEDKARIGVCIDTCHIFAAGYDLRSPKAFAETLKKFDQIVGMQYLKALHLNDSKAPLASHRDLHQNIGLGFLGLRAFHNVMNEQRFENLPLVLETPIDKKDETGKNVEDKGVWAREIKLLEGLIGKDPESDDFKSMEKELASKGAEERAKYADAFEKKKAKERKAAERGQTKLKFGKKEEEKDIGGRSDT